MILAGKALLGLFFLLLNLPFLVLFFLTAVKSVTVYDSHLILRRLFREDRVDFSEIEDVEYSMASVDQWWVVINQSNGDAQRLRFREKTKEMYQTINYTWRKWKQINV